MRKINLTLEVDDNFTPGNCYNCPLHYTEDYDSEDGFEFETRCVLSSAWEECPLAKELD